MPDLEAHASLITHSPAHTQQFGERLGRLIQPGDVICLSGELGAGKTTLAGGVARGWGAAGDVTSPTFVFVNEYQRAQGDRLYHVDAYRLRNAAEADSIALADLLSEPGSAALIEWPERVLEALPAERVWLTLRWESVADRAIDLTGVGQRPAALVQAVMSYDPGD